MTATVTDTVLVRALHADDIDTIYEIARESGLPSAWRWPRDTAGDPKHGAVAEVEGRVVAFCAISECVYGLVLDEYWCRRSREGVLGLGSLGRWAESVAQRLANERGEPLQLGGVVRLDNPTHKAALVNRGYTVEAEVLAKQFMPQGVA